jgi:hypothetical protein
MTNSIVSFGDTITTTNQPTNQRKQMQGSTCKPDLIDALADDMTRCAKVSECFDKHVHSLIDYDAKLDFFHRRFSRYNEPHDWEYPGKSYNDILSRMCKTGCYGSIETTVGADWTDGQVQSYVLHAVFQWYREECAERDDGLVNELGRLYYPEFIGWGELKWVLSWLTGSSYFYKFYPDDDKRAQERYETTVVCSVRHAPAIWLRMTPFERRRWLVLRKEEGTLNTRKLRDMLLRYRDVTISDEDVNAPEKSQEEIGKSSLRNLMDDLSSHVSRMLDDDPTKVAIQDILDSAMKVMNLNDE